MNLNMLLAMLQVGAFMNSTFQATDGLSADVFPHSIPTFTGHYHKPHTVGDTSIRYVGSPYQGGPCVAHRRHLIGLSSLVELADFLFSHGFAAGLCRASIPDIWSIGGSNYAASILHQVLAA